MNLHFRNIFFIIIVFCVLSYSQHIVVKVYDGDTFQIDTGEKERLLGIDTPQKWESGKQVKDSEPSGKDKETIKQLGQLSSDYAVGLLLNQKVTLIADSTNSDQDRYGRLLRFAYLEDGSLFNLKIIQDGYAYAYTKYPVIYMEDFLKHNTKLEKTAGGFGAI